MDFGAVVSRQCKPVPSWNIFTQRDLLHVVVCIHGLGKWCLCVCVCVWGGGAGVLLWRQKRELQRERERELQIEKVAQAIE